MLPNAHRLQKRKPNPVSDFHCLTRLSHGSTAAYDITPLFHNFTLDSVHKTFVAMTSTYAELTLAATSTPSVPTATATNISNNQGNSSSKPLLFFVALGFGVVFTNLWLVVKDHSQASREQVLILDTTGSLSASSIVFVTISGTDKVLSMRKPANRSILRTCNDRVGEEKRNL